MITGQDINPGVAKRIEIWDRARYGAYRSAAAETAGLDGPVHLLTQTFPSAGPDAAATLVVSYAGLDTQRIPVPVGAGQRAGLQGSASYAGAPRAGVAA